MTDYTELKRAAERIVEVQTSQDVPIGILFDEFEALASPEAILALIVENERLVAWREGLLKERAAHIRQRDQLKAESESLLAALKGMTSMYGYCWDIVDGGLLCMQDNVQRFEDAHEAAQKVIASMGKGEQS